MIYAATAATGAAITTTAPAVATILPALRLERREMTVSLFRVAIKGREARYNCTYLFQVTAASQ